MMARIRIWVEHMKRYPLASMMDQCMLVLFTLSLCFLFFLGGMLGGYFRLPAYNYIHDALEGGTAWVNQQRDIWQADRQQEEEQETEKTEQAKGDGLSQDYDVRRAWNGYTLVAERFDKPVKLIDMNGKVVHSWDIGFRKIWPEPKHIERPVPERLTFVEGAYLYPNGDLLASYSGYTDTPWGYGLAKLDSNAHVLWTYDERTHHNITVDKATGNIYVGTHHFETAGSLRLNGMPGRILADYIDILSPQGKRLKRISIIDAFRGTEFESYLYYRPAVGRMEWDLTHMNNIEPLGPALAPRFPMFKEGHLLVSLRNPSVILMLDPQSEKVVWAAKGPWQHQHHAHFLPNGHILVFDNMGLYQNGYVQSRMLEYDPKDGSIPWSYPTPEMTSRFLNPIYGHVNRLPNGNTLIDVAFHKRLFEITADGKTVWDYNEMKPKDPSDPRWGGMPIKSKGQWLRYPDAVLSNPTIAAASAITLHKRFGPEELPFLKKKTTKPAKQ